MEQTRWFMQEPLPLSNPYHIDRLLNRYLRHKLPAPVFKSIDADLARFGSRLVDEIEALGREAETLEPVLELEKNWVHVSPAWSKLNAIAAEEKLIKIGYERQYHRFSRIYQFAKLYLFHPSSAYYSCPLAMTDGAAKLIEEHGDLQLRKEAFRHLTSDDPREFWTSGQWMTERTGGSDLTGTETEAKEDANGWKVYGPKHFTSAITAPMAMLLAKTRGGKLSLFYAKVREDVDGSWRHLKIIKLKDKLGTRALPTAEIELKGLPVTLVGKEGEGVKTIATLFNISRIHNAFAAVSTSARVLQLWDSFARRRVAFGKPIIEHTLHQQLYRKMLRLHTDQFLLAFFVAELLGASECEPNDEVEKLLRLLTPIVKLQTAKQNLTIVCEALEGFGGAGYMEDLGIAKFLRDSQTLSIWEGTTNVLSLDALRAIHKENVLPVYFEWVERCLAASGRCPFPAASASQQERDAEKARALFKSLQALPKTEEHARRVADHIARLTALCLRLYNPESSSPL